VPEYSLLTINCQKDLNSISSIENFGFKSEIDEFIRNSLLDISIEAVNAFKSKVPVRTGQLRNFHIKADLSSLSNVNPTLRFFVVDTPHTASNGRSSALIAYELNLGNRPNSRRLFKRSRTSEAVGIYGFEAQGSPTRDWIDRAYGEFLRKTTKLYGLSRG